MKSCSSAGSAAVAAVAYPSTCDRGALSHTVLSTDPVRFFRDSIYLSIIGDRDV